MLLDISVPRLLGRATKIFLCCLLQTAVPVGTLRPFSIKSVLNECIFLCENHKNLLAAGGYASRPPVLCHFAKSLVRH